MLFLNKEKCQKFQEGKWRSWVLGEETIDRSREGKGVCDGETSWRNGEVPKNNISTKPFNIESICRLALNMIIMSLICMVTAFILYIVDYVHVFHCGGW